MPAPKRKIQEYLNIETRFEALKRENPARAAWLAEKAQVFVDNRWAIYDKMARQSAADAEEAKAKTVAPQAPVTGADPKG
jgi:hypothetical protein